MCLPEILFVNSSNFNKYVIMKESMYLQKVNTDKAEAAAVAPTNNLQGPRKYAKLLRGTGYLRH